MKATLLLAACALVAPAVHAEEAPGAYAIVQGPNGTVRASLFSPQQAGLPIAKVENRTVTLGDLSIALAGTHASHAGKKKAGKKSYVGVLDRLIGMRLISLEAHEIGLDDLPDVKEEMVRFADSSLREGLKAKVTAGIDFDPDEVERLYKDSVREWSVKSLVFDKEEDAAAALKEGKPWPELVKSAIAAKKAKGTDEVTQVSALRRALPAVLQALQKTAKPGDTTAPVHVEKGVAVMHVEAIKYPDDEKKRIEAEQWSLGRKQTVALAAFYQKLVKERAHIDEKLLASLDFEAKKPGLQGMLKDKRVIARIDGGNAVTVAELAKGLNDEFFHGVERAVSEKKVNPRKVPVFNSILYEELFAAEAHRQGLEKTSEYLRSVEDHRDALVFGKFVEKVILPDVKVTEADVKKEYEQHQAAYSFPAFYTLSSVAFETPAAAQAAIARLKSGTDFKWLKSNATGQLAESKRDLELDGTTLTPGGMPAELAKKLAGAKTGELKLYAPRDGGQYVIRVEKVTPPSPQPYLDVREKIARKVQQDRINQAVADWIAKLRKARDVKVYISRLGA